jgi:hypothetical protein
MNVEQFSPQLGAANLFLVLTDDGKLLSLGFPLAIPWFLLLTLPIQGKNSAKWKPRT